jgi:hypothetical protein
MRTPRNAPTTPARLSRSLSVLLGGTIARIPRRELVAAVTVLLAMFASAQTAAADDSNSFRVRYLSAEHVYLDGGRVDGLAIGDTLRVRRDELEVARLAVVYVADHSASCQVLAVSRPVRPGDVAVVIGRADEAGPFGEGPLGGTNAAGTGAATVATSDADAETYAQRTATDSAAYDRLSRRRVYGRVALRWQLSHANVGPRGTFSEPTLAADLTVPDVGLRDLDVELRGYLRHQSRPSSYGDRVPRDEWRNRIQTAAFIYRPEEGALRWQAGRIWPRAVAGVGWVDGGLLEGRVARAMWIGGFAGWEPSWRNSAFSTDVRKAGVYARHRTGRPGGDLLDLTLAAVGLYTASDVSREYLHFGLRADLGRDVGLQNALELDLNRRWRKERAGETVSLTGFFLGLRWRARRGLDLNASYDGRARYWTASYRSLPDSLFNDALRHAVRIRGRVALGKRASFTAHGGWRHQPQYEADVWSYGVALSRYTARLGATFDVIGFDGPLASGWRPSLTLRRPWGDGHALRTSGGAQLYRADRLADQRAQGWLAGGLDLALARRVRASADYRYEWGDDAGGHRLFAELAVRF